MKQKLSVRRVKIERTLNYLNDEAGAIETIKTVWPHRFEDGHQFSNSQLQMCQWRAEWWIGAICSRQPTDTFIGPFGATAEFKCDGRSVDGIPRK